MQSDEGFKELPAEEGLLSLETPVFYIHTSDLECSARRDEFAQRWSKFVAGPPKRFHAIWQLCNADDNRIKA